MSESTLSVAISKTESSISIESPTSFNQLVRVASATLSPIFGNFNLYIPIDLTIKYLDYKCIKIRLNYIPIISS